MGFETTTPAGCLSVKSAKEDGLDNYSLLVANKTMPQAYEALKGSADVFLISGPCQRHHRNTFVRGTDRGRCQRCCGRIYRKRTDDSVGSFPGEVSGGKPFFVNCYPRVVTQDGSREAQVLVDEMMEAAILNGVDWA